MADDLLPGDVRDFIVAHIDTIAQLEAMMLLRSQPSDGWDIVKIARRLYVSEPEVSHALGGLIDAGIVSPQDGTFVYNPSPELRPLAERVAMTYTQHLIPVTNLIHSKPKPSRIHQFADAFKFRRDR
jgi:hypothetical protein